MGEESLSPPQQMIRILMGFISARAAYAAAKIGLPDQVESGGSTPGPLAARLGVDESGLERLLRTLTGLGIMRVDASGRYFLTPVGETLRSDSPRSIREYAIYVHEFLYDLFAGLVGSVRVGKPTIAEILGAPLFSYLERNPGKAALFHAGLANRGKIEVPAVLEAYGFGGFRRVVDLGGGNGAFLSAILAAHPDMSGVLLERPTAIAAARTGAGGPLPRCELIEGDYFKTMPPDGDLYVFKRVLLDHSAEEVVQILRNVGAAMNPSGRVLVIEDLAGPVNEPSLAHLMDLTFLLVTTGRLRTAQEYGNLLGKAGFRLQRHLTTRADLHVLEAARASDLAGASHAIPGS